jgi:hypothetical protein
MHTILPHLLRRTVKVPVVGCGGTGSAVISGLPHLHQALLAYQRWVVRRADLKCSWEDYTRARYRPEDVGQRLARLPLFERDTFGLVEPIGEGENESELLQF